MKTSVHLLYLKFFFDAAHCGSVSESARINHVSQSTVSQGIKRLEQGLNVALSKHCRNRFVLTDAGRHLYLEAKEIFQAVRSLEEKMHSFSEKARSHLRIACPTSLAMTFLPRCMQVMTEKHPQISIEFHIETLPQIRHMLQQGVVDIGLGLESEQLSHLNCHPLFEGRFGLYHKDKVNLEEGIFVDHQKGLQIEALQNKYQNVYGKPLPIKAELKSWELVARFAERGIGCGFFPDYLLFESRFQNLQSIPLNFQDLTYRICALTLTQEAPSTAAQAFIDSIRYQNR